MWTSNPPHHRPRRALGRRTLDAVALAVALVFLPELLASRAGMALEPHPGWIAVLILAARYGSTGLFTGLVTAASAAGIGSLVGGAGLVALWNRLDSGPNLIAFGACLAVSAVASLHLRNQADLCERVAVLSDRAAKAEAATEAMRGVVAVLRARVDRTSTSLSFLRDVAARMEGIDPVAAAEGAADLALARSGACAVAVHVGTHGWQRVLAARDARGPKAIAPLAACEADLTVPIVNGSDRVGSIALWGIPGPAVDEPTAHDLAVIASWCAPALAIVGWHPEEAACCPPKVT